MRTVRGAVLAFVLLGGCGGTEEGSPAPASPAGQPMSSAAPPTSAPAAADVDPCTLLTEPELAGFGLPPQGELMEEPDARFCAWQTPELRFGVAIGSGTLQEVETGLGIGTGETATVAGREGRRITSPGICGFITELAPDRVLGVIFAARDPAADSCGTVDQATALVLPRVG